MHVAVTYDGESNGSGLKIYVNGELLSAEGVKTGNPQSIENTSELELGTAYDGIIDDFRIFSRELSMSEVQSVMNGGEVSGTVHRWSFDHEGETDDEGRALYFDEVSGNHGISQAPSWTTDVAPPWQWTEE